MEEIFAIHKSGKGLISNIYKILLKLKIKNTSNAILKWAKHLNWQFTKEDKWMANKHIRKAQYH